ncbi:MAG: class I SAM-dependent methyltransferase [Proteobacteria bacterium]|nr:class I SAM-dependent methyltransferase [Pseudomonadota bacterium]MBU4258606.1 class I SAM-dependent methyltransferase [Pseudomonadota bacterium]MBU4287672.1 class I SAM-dependent methyltransferase [Pseudomonadota bacterium]MBU4413555.1 class I SAM-dependent methyltransferase [Pseudomonadota bacterium]MCG2759560.1 class I SAM-dependent methyltransferase [Desulfobacteraceae bacterium]
MNIDDIEYINALGPFDHGVWEGRSSDGQKVKVGDNALFRNRSEWLVDKISTCLIKEFTLETLRTMTLLEIGSYDGWVLTQICKRIEFLEAIGIEPRKKNLIKGEVGRRLEKINTQAKFIQGSAEDLDRLFVDRDFDIVMCLGMLHHVSSAYDTIRRISKYASKSIIIDSMIVPELQDDAPKLQPYVNTRDIIYQGEKGTWSIAAFKYESPYGDGSGVGFGIVNIPSASLIQMSLHNCGFSKTTLLGDENDFFDKSDQQLRGVKEFFAVSKREIKRGEEDKKWREKVENSEEIFCHTNLPEKLIVSLAKNFPGFDDLKIYDDLIEVTGEVSTEDIDDIVSRIFSQGLTEDDQESLRMNVEAINDKHFQILAVIFRLPYEKIIVEVGKFFLSNGYPDLAVKYFQLVIRKPGCDWWSFYRSCYILCKALRQLGRTDESKRYKDLLSLSNENFPF